MRTASRNVSRSTDLAEQLVRRLVRRGAVRFDAGRVQRSGALHRRLKSRPAQFETRCSKSWPQRWARQGSWAVFAVPL